MLELGGEGAAVPPKRDKFSCEGAGARGRVRRGGEAGGRPGGSIPGRVRLNERPLELPAP